MPQIRDYNQMRKPRKITPTDSALTLPGRVTFPVGTYTNPSTAVYGSLGGPSGGAPGHPPTLEEQLNISRLTYNNFLNNPQGATNLNFGAPRPEPGKAPTNANPISFNPGAPGSGVPPVGHGIVPISYTNNVGNQANPELNFANRSAGIVKYMQSTSKLPNYLTPQDLGYMRNNGLDPSQLAQFYTFDAKTGSYAINQQGQSVNQTTGAGSLKPGQYVDVNSGQVKNGATPFGTTASGQRLDASGNVWDPKTATRDIYGGQFIQVGEVRWERNKAGRLIKVQYGKGGKKRVVAGGSKQKNKPSQQPAPAPAPAPAAAPVQQTYQSYENVSFNTASG